MSPSDTLGPSGGPAASASRGPDPGALTLRLEPFAEGVSSPVFVTHAGDGSGLLYAVERGGTIRIVEPDGSVRPDPFLDITARVTSGGEQGLLGLAFHPAYPDDGRFYVMYTAAGDGANTVSEFTATGAAADPASERVLLSIPDFASNHNGGMVAFGPDGYLYIGTGDGGGGGDPEENGQDPFALLGKILRIDIEVTGSDGAPYAIPADNPFGDGARAAPEVWALGMRNPWRFSFDRETGDIWIGDVGQGRWEEIDAEPAGAGGRNYGWDIMEGPDCFEEEGCDTAGLTLPVAAYTHDEGGCTVIGGYVYRGDSYPDVEGTYLYGDYCSGLVWGLDAAAAMATGTAQPVQFLEEGMTLSAFGEDEAGELYAVDLAGRILRLIWE
jgi:glucose/arabinose dehydrogenase